MGQSGVEVKTVRGSLWDARLNRWLGTMPQGLAERPGKSSPRAFQDWLSTKASKSDKLLIAKTISMGCCCSYLFRGGMVHR